MENTLNPVETELFNALKYKRYASIGIEVDDIWIFAGTTYWVNDEGQLHRENGPAVECPSETKYWYQNGLRHREDGPAIEYSDGSKSWFINGKLIRSE